MSPFHLPILKFLAYELEFYAYYNTLLSNLSNFIKQIFTD